MKAIGSNEVGGVNQESNVVNADEHTKEVQCVCVCVFDSTVAEFDPRLLRSIIETSGDRFHEPVWTCVVNVRGSGHRVFPSFQRSG